MAFDLAQAGRYLLQLVSRARKRKLRIDLVEGFLEALFCLSFLLAAFFLLDRVRLELWPRGSCLSPRAWILSAILVSAAFALAYASARAWWRVSSPVAAAKELDDAFGLADRVVTSIDVVEGRAAGRLGPMVVADTVRCVQELDLRRAYPFPAPGYRLLSALSLGVTLWLAFLPLPAPPPTPLSSVEGRGGRFVLPPEGQEDDPYLRFGSLPDDPRIRSRDAQRPPKEKEPPPWAKEKPPKQDPPSKLPNPDMSERQQPSAGGGGGGGNAGGGGGGGGNGSPGQPQQPKPAEPGKQQGSPPPGGGEPGGNAPGKGHTNPWGEKGERTPVHLLPKEVKPLLGQGKGREKEMEIDEGTGDPASGGTQAAAPADFRTLFANYQRLPENAVSQERISPEDQDLVKRYFQQIQPGR